VLEQGGTDLLTAWRHDAEWLDIHAVTVFKTKLAALPQQGRRGTQRQGGGGGGGPSGTRPLGACFQFQTGHCTKGASCRYPHTCNLCNSVAHGSASCPRLLRATSDA